MSPTGSTCLVCDGAIDDKSKDVFKCEMLGFQPLKERLQVVLQFTLDEESCHSKLLCSQCAGILDNIDEYQCNVDTFYETFQETLKRLSSVGGSSMDRCLTCFGSRLDLDREAFRVITEDTGTPSLKSRLEEILAVPLNQHIKQCRSICVFCIKSLERIESELQVVYKFAATYRKTQESKQLENGVTPQKRVPTNGLVKVAKKAKPKSGHMYNDPNVVVGVEDVDDIKNLIEKTNTGLRCLVCGYANLRLCHMRTHIRLHTGSKPYKCQGCRRAFTDRSNCNKHVRKCAILLKQALRNKGKNGKARSGWTKTRTESKGANGEDEEGEDEGEEDLYQKQCSISGREILTGEVTDSSLLSMEEGMEFDEKGDGYSCSECDMTLGSAQALRAHMAQHDSAGDTVRDIVSGNESTSAPVSDLITSEINSIVNRFMDSNHKVPEEPPAKRRRSRLPRPKCLSDSLVRENGANYECTVCHYTSSLPHVLTHARKHTGEKPYSCKYCGKRYADASNFIRHENKHEEQEENAQTAGAESQQAPSHSLHGSSPIVLDSGSDEEGRKPSKTFPFECSLCNRSFKNSSALTEHIRQHMEDQNKQELESGSRNGNLTAQFPSERQNLPVTDPPSCMDLATVLSVGGELSARRSKRLSSTSRTSVGMLSPDGSDHDMDAMSQAYSESHDQSFDDEDPTAVTQEVRDALILWDDARSVYKCAKCSYNNYVLYNLRKHIRTHTGEKPFKCEFCHRRFADKSNQRKHERKHHLDGDIPLSMVQSTPATPEHKPFQCDICKVSFRYEGTLKKHRELHDDQKSFVCQKPGCGKRFFSLFDLQRHESLQCRKINSHPLSITSDGEMDEEDFTGEIIRCEDCGIIFALARDLERHKVKEHGGGGGGGGALNTTSPPTDVFKQSSPGERSSSLDSSSDSTQLPDKSYDLASLPEVYKRSFLTIEQVDGRTYQCLICSHTSDKINDIVTHQSRRHLKSEMQQCEEFVQYTLMDFLLDLGAGRYQCKLCPYQSDIMIKIRVHLRESHNAKIHPLSSKVTGDDVHKNKIMRKDPASVYYECLFCFARHKAPKMLARHVKNKHPEEYSRAMLPRDIKPSDLQISDVRSISNERLKEFAPSAIQTEKTNRSRTSSSSSVRSKGTRTRTDSSGEKGSRKPATETSSASLPVQTPRDDLLRGNFACHLCTKIFPEPGDLQIHFGEHCLGQVFPFTVALRNEVKFQGFNQYFPCLLCGATYLNRSSLEQHRLSHRSEFNQVVPISQSPSGPVGVPNSTQCMYGPDSSMPGPHSLPGQPPGLMAPSGPVSPIGHPMPGEFNSGGPTLPPQRSPLQDLGLMQAGPPSLGGTPPSQRMPTFAGFKCPLCFLTFTHPQELMAHVDTKHKHSGSQNLQENSALSTQPAAAPLPQPPLHPSGPPREEVQNIPPVAPHTNADPPNVIKIEPITSEPGPTGSGSMKLPIMIQGDPAPSRLGVPEQCPNMKDVTVYQPFKPERKSSYDAFKLEQGNSLQRQSKSPGKASSGLLSDFQVFNRPRLPVAPPDVRIQPQVTDQKPIEIAPRNNHLIGHVPASDMPMRNPMMDRAKLEEQQYLANKGHWLSPPFAGPNLAAVEDQSELVNKSYWYGPQHTGPRMAGVEHQADLGNNRYWFGPPHTGSKSAAETGHTDFENKTNWFGPSHMRPKLTVQEDHPDLGNWLTGSPSHMASKFPAEKDRRDLGNKINWLGSSDMRSNFAAEKDHQDLRNKSHWSGPSHKGSNFIKGEKDNRDSGNKSNWFSSSYVGSDLAAQKDHRNLGNKSNWFGPSHLGSNFTAQKDHRDLGYKSNWFSPSQAGSNLAVEKDNRDLGNKSSWFGASPTGSNLPNEKDRADSGNKTNRLSSYNMRSNCATEKDHRDVGKKKLRRGLPDAVRNDDLRNKSDEIILELLTEKEKPPSLKIEQSVGGVEGLWNRPDPSETPQDSTCSSTLGEIAKKLAIKRENVNSLKTRLEKEHAPQSIEDEFQSSENSVSQRAETSSLVKNSTPSAKSNVDHLFSGGETDRVSQGNDMDPSQCVILSSEDEEAQGDSSSTVVKKEKDSEDVGNAEKVAPLTNKLNSSISQEEVRDETNAKEQSEALEALPSDNTSKNCQKDMVPPSQRTVNPDDNNMLQAINTETEHQGSRKEYTPAENHLSLPGQIERACLLIDSSKAMELVKGIRSPIDMLTGTDMSRGNQSSSSLENANSITKEIPKITSLPCTTTEVQVEQHMEQPHKGSDEVENDHRAIETPARTIPSPVVKTPSILEDLPCESSVKNQPHTSQTEEQLEQNEAAEALMETDSGTIGTVMNEEPSDDQNNYTKDNTAITPTSDSGLLLENTTKGDLTEESQKSDAANSENVSDNNDGNDDDGDFGREISPCTMESTDSLLGEEAMEVMESDVSLPESVCPTPESLLGDDIESITSETEREILQSDREEEQALTPDPKEQGCGMVISNVTSSNVEICPVPNGTDAGDDRDACIVLQDEPMETDERKSESISERTCEIDIPPDGIVDSQSKENPTVCIQNDDKEDKSEITDSVKNGTEQVTHQSSIPVDTLKIPDNPESGLISEDNGTLKDIEVNLGQPGVAPPTTLISKDNETLKNIDTKLGQPGGAPSTTCRRLPEENPDLNSLPDQGKQEVLTQDDRKDGLSPFTKVSAAASDYLSDEITRGNKINDGDLGEDLKAVSVPLDGSKKDMTSIGVLESLGSSENQRDSEVHLDKSCSLDTVGAEIIHTEDVAKRSLDQVSLNPAGEVMPVSAMKAGQESIENIENSPDTSKCTQNLTENLISDAEKSWCSQAKITVEANHVLEETSGIVNDNVENNPEQVDLEKPSSIPQLSMNTSPWNEDLSGHCSLESNDGLSLSFPKDSDENSPKVISEFLQEKCGEKASSTDSPKDWSEEILKDNVEMDVEMEIEKQEDLGQEENDDDELSSVGISVEDMSNLNQEANKEGTKQSVLNENISPSPVYTSLSSEKEKEESFDFAPDKMVIPGNSPTPLQDTFDCVLSDRQIEGTPTPGQTSEVTSDCGGIVKQDIICNDRSIRDVQKMEVEDLNLTAASRHTQEDSAPHTTLVRGNHSAPQEPDGKMSKDSVQCDSYLPGVNQSVTDQETDDRNSGVVHTDDITSNTDSSLVQNLNIDSTNDPLSPKEDEATLVSQPTPQASGSGVSGEGNSSSDRSDSNSSLSTAPDAPRKTPVIATCTLCGTDFSTKAGYLQHLQSHAKFSCPSCSASFHDIALLYRHFDEEH